MANINERNVAGLLTGNSIDSITFRLHSNDGPEVQWNVWEDQDGEYHVFAEIDEYLQMVESIPTASSRWLSLINSFIASHTYNSIRPLIEDEDAWLELNEEELDRD